MASLSNSYGNTISSSQGIDSQTSIESPQSPIQNVATMAFQTSESTTDRKIEGTDITAEVANAQSLPKWAQKARKQIKAFKQKCEEGIPGESKKRILILVACIVGVIFSMALIASGVGAILGMGGLATALGGLGLVLGFGGILASCIGFKVLYSRSREKELKLIQNKERMKLEKAEYEKIEDAIQNDLGYREFVESIYSKFKEISSAEKIATHLSTSDKVHAPILEAHQAIQSVASDFDKMMIRFEVEMSYLNSLLKNADDQQKKEIQREKDHMVSGLFKKMTELTSQKEFKQVDDLLTLSRSYK